MSVMQGNIIRVCVMVLGLFTISKADPPSKLEVENEYGTMPSGVTVEVIAGSDVKFTCEATGAWSSQPSVLDWFFDNQPHPDDANFPKNIPTSPYYTGVLSESTIPIGWSLHGGILNCRINHHELLQPLNHFLTLDVKVPPSASNIQLTDADKPEGYTVGETASLTQGIAHEFTCTIIGARPSALVAWYVGSKEQTSNVVTVVQDNAEDPLLADTTSKFTFNPTREDHHSDIVCLSFIVVREVPSYAFDINLAVNVPPDTPHILDPGGLREGYTYNIICEAKNMFPVGKILWFMHPNIDVTNSSTQTDVENVAKLINVKSSLEYTATRLDNGNMLRCEVRQMMETGPNYPQATIDFNIEFCPNTFTLSVPDGIVDGTSGTLSAHSSSANPTVDYQYWRAFPGQPLLLQNNTHDNVYEDSDFNGKTTSQNFTTDVLGKNDYGVRYRCCYEHPRCSSCRDYYPIVYYAPTIQSIQVPPTPFPEGTSVILRCYVDENPAPEDSVTWQRDYIDVIGDVSFDGSIGTLTLTASKSSAGYYRCIANNGIGEDISYQLPLTVLYSPNITTKSDTIFRGLEGKIIHVNCTAIGNPRPTFAWSDPNGIIPANGTERIKLEEIIDVSDEVRGTVVTGKLTISGFQPSGDVGTYLCNVTNDHGVDSHSLQIQEATSPLPPASIAVLDDMTTSYSLSIQWEPGDDGGIEQWYQVSFRINDDGTDFGREEKVEGATETTLKGLNSSTEYEIKIIAENVVGRSQGATYITSFTLPTSPVEKDIHVTYYPNRDQITVSNYNGNDNECLQLEVDYDNAGNWTDFEDCRSEDVTDSVDDQQEVEFRSSICLTVDEEVTCGESSPAEVDNSNVNPDAIVIIIAVTVSAGILIILLVIAIVCFVRRKKKDTSGLETGNVQASPGVQMNRYVNADQDSIPDTRTEAKRRKDYEKRQKMPLPPIPGGRDFENAAYERDAIPSKQKAKQRIKSSRPDLPEVSGEFWIPFEDFEIGETLGEGHYGSVLKGTWGNKPVAIKMMKEEATEEYRESMKTELKTMIDVTAKCTNPNVARLLGWSYYEDNLYIVMEFLSGGSLYDFLRKNTKQGVTWRKNKKGTIIVDPDNLPAKVTGRDLYQFAIDVARGMEYLSDHNIVHRDLAARNVLMDANQNCKVSDFGLARNVMGKGEYVVTSMKELPARWMAIESLMTSTFTSKSDVWSFGVLLWEMTAFGRKPYVDDGIESRYLRVKLSQGWRLKPKASCPQTMKGIMKECWEEDPDRRPEFKAIRVRLENGMKTDPDTVSSSVC